VLRPHFVARLEYIKTLSSGKDVLNLGCADVTRLGWAAARGQHLHIELSKVARRLVGVDISPGGLEELRSVNGALELVCYDVERVADLASRLRPFDVVVAGELIEHLKNPGLMLRGVRDLLKGIVRLSVESNGSRVIHSTTPFCV